MPRASIVWPAVWGGAPGPRDTIRPPRTTIDPWLMTVPLPTTIGVADDES
jgi:hypothetical protein